MNYQHVLTFHDKSSIHQFVFEIRISFLVQFYFVFHLNKHNLIKKEDASAVDNFHCLLLQNFRHKTTILFTERLNVELTAWIHGVFLTSQSFRDCIMHFKRVRRKHNAMNLCLLLRRQKQMLHWQFLQSLYAERKCCTRLFITPNDAPWKQNVLKACTVMQTQRTWNDSLLKKKSFDHFYNSFIKIKTWKATTCRKSMNGVCKVIASSQPMMWCTVASDLETMFVGPYHFFKLVATPDGQWLYNKLYEPQEVNINGLWRIISWLVHLFIALKSTKSFLKSFTDS